MKIYVRDIKPEGLEVNEIFPADLVDQREDDHLVFVEPFKLNVRICKADYDVMVAITVDGKFSSFCSRCLENVEQCYQSKFDLHYVVEKRGMEFIELDEDIRQEILLNLSFRVLCQDSCRGLCPDCGINLNKEKCKCRGGC